MRPLALVALLGVAASAAVSVVTQRVWKLEGVGEFSPFEVVLTASESEIKIRAGGVSNRFAHAVLTRDEAASLGRALLEAAGETEKKCEAVETHGFILPRGDLGMPSHTVTTECTPEKCPAVVPNCPMGRVFVNGAYACAKLTMDGAK